MEFYRGAISILSYAQTILGLLDQLSIVLCVSDMETSGDNM